MACLKKGMFAHSSEKTAPEKRFLKQANFVLTRAITRRMRDNNWQCQWCTNFPLFTKKQALFHVRTQHGSLLKRTTSTVEIARQIQELEAAALKKGGLTGANLNYPCHATSYQRMEEPHTFIIKQDTNSQFSRKPASFAARCFKIPVANFTGGAAMQAIPAELTGAELRSSH